MKTVVTQVRTGRVQAFGANGEPSAFRKTETLGAVAVDVLGLQGDEQADLKHHGGVDKAILHYAYDHYATWCSERPELRRHLQSPGAFGENISSHGMTEDTVCVGDRFQLGSTIVEVSQGRQPCWKLGHHFGLQEIISDVIRTGRGGWYYRVIQPGQVAAGDTIELISRPHPDWPVSRVSRLLLGPHRDADMLAALQELQPLSGNWRARARRRLQAG